MQNYSPNVDLVITHLKQVVVTCQKQQGHNSTHKKGQQKKPKMAKRKIGGIPRLQVRSIAYVRVLRFQNN
jgi:hypothetical protein